MCFSWAQAEVDSALEREINCSTALQEKGEPISEEELDESAAIMGYGAVKYQDLKNNRLTNYRQDIWESGTRRYCNLGWPPTRQLTPPPPPPKSRQYASITYL